MPEVDAGALVDIDIEALVDIGTLDVVVDEPALLRAALMSWGIIRGVVPAALRSMNPLLCITSGLAARKLRVKSTFSTAY